MAIIGSIIPPAAVDMVGKELILDADADTSITADTDDQIDIKIAGADDFSFKANTFEVQTGSNIDMNGTELILDADADTSITADTDDTIDIKIAGADDFQFSANSFNVLSGSTLTIDSGATIVNSGTATNFGTDSESAYAGVLQTNANFVDQVIFGPSVDGVPWNGAWSKASVYSSLMLATIEDEGSNTEINIWDLTEQTSGVISTTPLATVDLANAATPTGIAAAMGYLIVSSEDGIAIIDPHSGAWAERTTGWPISLTASTTPALAFNDVKGVAACVTDPAPLDPNTGGPIPTFGVKYVTGSAKANSIIKHDGNVWDIAGDGTSGADYGMAFVGSKLLTHYNDGQFRLAQDPNLITADISVNPPYSWHQAESQGWNIAVAADHAASNGTLTALGAGEGLGISMSVPHSINAAIGSTIAADITRAFNTGFYTYIVKGLWLANSKTVDRGPQANTLTENGTVPTGAVESGAELTAYGPFSDSNYLSRASDADWDVIGTGSCYMSLWLNSTGESSTRWAMGFSNSGDTIQLCMRFQANGLMSCVDDGATARVETNTSLGWDDSKWHKIDFVRVSPTERYAYVDGVLTTTSTTDAGSISSSGNLPFSIGSEPDGATGGAVATKLALCKMSTTVPTDTQIRQMYDAEKGMFVASAECLLQSGSTDAVIDVDVDPLSSKVLVTQTDAITIFDGCVVDSKPTVNSGASEKGKLWGDLRAEQNSANAYVTAPAVDQRQVNEMVRSLASDLPAGVDLSKAKAWVMQSSNTSTPIIQASLNIESITNDGTGLYTVTFGVPFKYDALGSGGASKVGWAGFYTGHVYMSGGIYVANADSARTHAKVYTKHNDNTMYNTSFSCVFFGELENE